ncbi:MAG: hypothetical protein HOW73_04775 [Polyangiaceae bacterium]|nr:hypothetical protein [Polyangiaceae bacterium]
MRALLGAAVAVCCLLAAVPARAQDAAAIVAKARDQVDSGNYADALRTLSALKSKNVPPQLAVEAGLLETTALLVTNADAASQACGRAIIAAGYDPDVARDLSPKVRDACRAAAKKVRGERVAGDKATIGKLEIEAPEVAFQPVRLSTTVENRPAWLRMVARVESSGIEGAFDVPLIPSDEGPLLGTLDPSWIRPSAKLSIKLVAQDRFGDLNEAVETRKVDVPAAEAAVALGTVPDGAKVTLDGQVIVPDGKGRIAAPAGKHEVAMSLTSGAYAEAEIELSKGEVARLALAPQAPSPSRALPWVATGTAVALGVAGGVLLINSEARRSELEDAAKEREPGTDLPANDFSTLQDIDDERKLFQYVGIGLLSGAGAVAVTATVLWLVPVGGGSSSSASIEPVISPGFIGARGRF